MVAAMTTVVHTSKFDRWLGILGFLIGLIGIGLAVWFYLISIAEREPVYLVDPDRTTIINSKSFPNTTLKVLKGDNTPIKEDVSSLRFYFWNNGKVPIEDNDILKPLVFSLSDPNTQILDVKILKASRDEIVQAKLTPDDTNFTKSFELTFDILENDDGITGQIIFSGNPNADLFLSGTVKGAKEIKRNVSISSVRFWKDILKNIGWILLGILGFVISVFAFKSVVPFFDKVFKSIPSVVIKIVIGLFLVGLGWGAVLQLTKKINQFKKEADIHVIESIPESIKP
jgi:hypothetical protein